MLDLKIDEGESLVAPGTAELIGIALAGLAWKILICLPFT